MQQTLRHKVRDAHAQDLPAAAQGAEIRHLPVPANQPKQALQEPCRLPQRLATEDLHRPAGPDGSAAVDGPSPPLAGRLRRPNHVRIDPDRQRSPALEPVATDVVHPLALRPGRPGEGRPGPRCLARQASRPRPAPGRLLRGNGAESTRQVPERLVIRRPVRGLAGSVCPVRPYQPATTPDSHDASLTDLCDRAPTDEPFVKFRTLGLWPSKDPPLTRPATPPSPGTPRRPAPADRPPSRPVTPSPRGRWPGPGRPRRRGSGRSAL